MPDNLPAPVTSKKGKYGEIELIPKINLLSPEGRSKLGIKYEETQGINLPTFEKLRQRSGLVLYETTLNETDGVLTITEPRDWILVYVDSVCILPKAYKINTHVSRLWCTEALCCSNFNGIK